MFKRNNKARERFHEIAEDLMTLEVNTIVKTHMMTTRKMPSPAHALLDIATYYEFWLRKPRRNGHPLKIYVAKIEENSAGRKITPEEGELEQRRIDAQTFYNLYATARAALEPEEGESRLVLSTSEETILERIRKSSIEAA